MKSIQLFREYLKYFEQVRMRCVDFFLKIGILLLFHIEEGVSSILNPKYPLETIS